VAGEVGARPHGRTRLPLKAAQHPDRVEFFMAK
jgi:hypothetical protein